MLLEALPDVSVRVRAELSAVPAEEMAEVPDATNAALAAVDVLMPLPASTEGTSKTEVVKVRGVVTEETLRKCVRPAKFGRSAGHAATAAL